MVTTSTADREVANNITRFIAARGSSQRHVYESAGMAVGTFRRSITGGRSFTVDELEKIAAALGIDPVDLLPTSWDTATKGAA